MVVAQQVRVQPGQTVQPGQFPVGGQQVSVSPYATAAPSQFDIGSLLTSIMPLIMMILMFQLLKPMISGMSEVAK